MAKLDQDDRDWITAKVNGLASDLTGLVVRQVQSVKTHDDVDEQEIITGVLKGLDPKVIAGAIIEASSKEQAKAIVDELVARLKT